MINFIKEIFQNILGYGFIYLVFLIFAPFLYIEEPREYFKEHMLFFKIPLYIRILFLIFYILLYIFSSKKHKKYVLISFIILYLCFAFIVVPDYIAYCETL